MKDTSTYIIKWLNICCILIFIMVLVGGVTRLTQSGLSMVHWKPIMGIIPPLNEQQWQISFNQYKKYPEYKEINQFQGMNLYQYKRIFYWEYAHRILGRIIGLFYILPFFVFIRKGYINNRFIKPIIFTILLIVVQGLFGWYMVKSGLVDNPHVSHFRLAVHLFLAFFLIAYTYWIKLSIENVNNNKKKFNLYFSNLIKIMITLYVFQVLFGTFIAGTKAGLLWNTFPLIEGKLIPDGLFILKPIYNNFINNMKMFQFAHRLLGTILMLYAGWFYYVTKDESFNNESRFLFMLFLMQFYIGIMTLLLRVPVFMGVVHQGFAVIILLVMTRIIFFVYKDKLLKARM